MTTIEPFSGSLLRLAISTIAIMAVFAGALAFWQGSHDANAQRVLSGNTMTVVNHTP